MAEQEGGAWERKEAALFTARKGLRLMEYLGDRLESEKAKGEFYQHQISIFENGLNILHQMQGSGGFDPDLALYFSEKFKSNQLLGAIRTSGVSAYYGISPERIALTQQLKLEYTKVEQQIIESKD
ncbi:MAG TPA: hypothetical protein ENJ82_09350, partial [Bacteroidetes bacterium]|nr:hypothetical protein [Bacteroidota bacterium]